MVSVIMGTTLIPIVANREYATRSIIRADNRVRDYSVDAHADLPHSQFRDCFLAYAQELMYSAYVVGLATIYKHDDGVSVCTR
jgi:hypothetical protein